MSAHDVPLVLLVEDNSDDEALTLRAKRKSGISYEIDVVRDGAEAVDYLSGGGRDLPKLVLLDIRLPKVDGLQVLRRIREQEGTAPVPVVILITSQDEQDTTRRYQLGANSGIHKPVAFLRFADAVRNPGLYWLMLNQSPSKGAHEN